MKKLWQRLACFALALAFVGAAIPRVIHAAGAGAEMASIEQTIGDGRQLTRLDREGDELWSYRPPAGQYIAYFEDGRDGVTVTLADTEDNPGENDFISQILLDAGNGREKRAEKYDELIIHSAVGMSLSSGGLSYNGAGLEERLGLQPVYVNSGLGTGVSMGYADAGLKVIIEPEYKLAGNFNDGCAVAVDKDGDYVIIDMSGRVLKIVGRGSEFGFDPAYILPETKGDVFALPKLERVTGAGGDYSSVKSIGLFSFVGNRLGDYAAPEGYSIIPQPLGFVPVEDKLWVDLTANWPASANPQKSVCLDKTGAATLPDIEPIVPLVDIGMKPHRTVEDADDARFSVENILRQMQAAQVTDASGGVVSDAFWNSRNIDLVNRYAEYAAAKAFEIENEGRSKELLELKLDGFLTGGDWEDNLRDNRNLVSELSDTIEDYAGGNTASVDRVMRFKMDGPSGTVTMTGRRFGSELGVSVIVSVGDVELILNEEALDQPFEISVRPVPGGGYEIQKNIDMPIRVSIPAVSGLADNGQAVYNSAGENIGGVLNPITGKLEFELKSGDGVTAKQNASSFTDLEGLKPEVRNAIEYLRVKGRINGRNPEQFDPNGGITRVEFAAMLLAALNQTDETAEPIGPSGYYPDIKPTDGWIAYTAGAAYKRNYMSNLEDGSFSPHMSITKEQLVAISGRVLRENGIGLLGIDSERIIRGYYDGNVVPDWAVDDCARAVANDLCLEYLGGRFKPKYAMTRQEAAYVIYNLYVRIN